MRFFSLVGLQVDVYGWVYAANREEQRVQSSAGRDVKQWTTIDGVSRQMCSSYLK